MSTAAAKQTPPPAATKGTKKPHHRTNPILRKGLRKYSRSQMYARKRLWTIKTKTRGPTPSQAKKEVKSKKAPIDASSPKKFLSTVRRPHPVCRHFTPKIAKLRESLVPGTVLILLAGRYAGRRVVLLRQMPTSGLLLVTGPFRMNGVPLRRVGASFVIATATRVEVPKEVAEKAKEVKDEMFNRRTNKDHGRKGENEFFAERKAKKAKKGEEAPKKEGKKTEVSKKRLELQKAIDAPLCAAAKKVPLLVQYLKSRFTLSKGQYPHAMKF